MDKMLIFRNLSLKTKDPEAFELMHRELDKVWNEVDRVMKKGGFVCVNIGDATRNLSIFFNYIQIRSEN